MTRITQSSIRIRNHATAHTPGAVAASLIGIAHAAILDAHEIRPPMCGLEAFNVTDQKVPPAPIVKTLAGTLVAGNEGSIRLTNSSRRIVVLQ